MNMRHGWTDSGTLGGSLTRRQLLAVAGPSLLVGRLLAQPSSKGGKSTPPPTSREIFYDTDGLIVHHTADRPDGFDGGDTAQREGWYWVGRWIREKVLQDPWPVPRTVLKTFPEVLRLLEPNKDGIFYRHPKLSPWNNPTDKKLGFSIDQMTPLVAAMGLWGQTDALRRLWNRLPQDPTLGMKHTFNGPLQPIEVAGVTIGGYYTGDLVFGKFINLFRRAWGEDPMKASDGNGPFGEADLSGLVCIRSSMKDLDDTGDDLNLIVMLLMAILRQPSNLKTTFTIPQLPDVSAFGEVSKYLAVMRNCNELTTSTSEYVRAYKKRAPTYGSYLEAYRKEIGDPSTAADSDLRKSLDEGIIKGWKPDKRTVLGAVRWYHRPQVGANPQLADLYDPIIRRYFEA